MIGETLRLVAYSKRFGGIRIEPSLAQDLQPALADQSGTQQVLLNLLFNAADAARREGGVIRVITQNQSSPHCDGDCRVIMRVADNGCGIAPENLERVFDPFFTTKAAGGGVGLGLSLCQNIVLTNRGTIGIESDSSRGTTVTISLPIFSEAAQNEAAPQA